VVLSHWNPSHFTAESFINPVKFRAASFKLSADSLENHSHLSREAVLMMNGNKRDALTAENILSFYDVASSISRVLPLFDLSF